MIEWNVMVRPSTLEKTAATSVAESTSGPVGQYVFPICAEGDAAIAAATAAISRVSTWPMRPSPVAVPKLLVSAIARAIIRKFCMYALFFSNV